MSEKWEDEQFPSILVVTWTNLVQYLFILGYKNSKEQISHRSNFWPMVHLCMGRGDFDNRADEEHLQKK